MSPISCGDCGATVYQNPTTHILCVQYHLLEFLGTSSVSNLIFCFCFSNICMYIMRHLENGTQVWTVSFMCLLGTVAEGNFTQLFLLWVCKPSLEMRFGIFLLWIVGVQIKLDFGTLWISQVRIREFQVQFNILVCVVWEDVREKVWGRTAGMGVAMVNRLFRVSFIGMLKF